MACHNLYTITVMSMWEVFADTCNLSNALQLFYSFFKSLVGKEVIIELKNDLW